MGTQSRSTTPNTLHSCDSAFWRLDPRNLTHADEILCLQSTRTTSWIFLGVTVVDAVGLVSAFFAEEIAQDFLVAMPLSWAVSTAAYLVYDYR